MGERERGRRGLIKHARTYEPTYVYKNPVSITQLEKHRPFEMPVSRGARDTPITRKLRKSRDFGSPDERAYELPSLRRR